MKRSISLIDTDSSNSPRAHSVWQVWGQTRPVTAGTGLRKKEGARGRGHVALADARQVRRYVDAVGTALGAAGEGVLHLGLAEDGVVARVSGEGVAGVAALAQAVEEVVGHPVVPAAVVLADIPGHGAHLPDMGRGRPCRRLGQRGVLVSDRRVGGQIFQPGQRADAQTSRFPRGRSPGRGCS